MPTRERAPLGSPCWADLWTSDVEGSRKFYGELFGWESEEPNPEFGGYFNFLREGVMTAGAMGDMGDMPAQNVWKVYLATDDINKTVSDAEAAGAQIAFPPMAVAELGIQTVMSDPTGAGLGAWQAGTFPGFTVLGEPGAPSWFEVHTRDFTTAIKFYQDVFGWKTNTVGDTDEFRYSTMADPEGGIELAGIMDARGFMPKGVPAHWSIYWETADVDTSVAKVASLGGAVVRAPEDTPYGRMATVTDPCGAEFKLRTGPE
jgi:hypothetical protein